MRGGYRGKMNGALLNRVPRGSVGPLAGQGHPSDVKRSANLESREVGVWDN